MKSKLILPLCSLGLFSCGEDKPASVAGAEGVNASSTLPPVQMKSVHDVARKYIDSDADYVSFDNMIPEVSVVDSYVDDIGKLLVKAGRVEKMGLEKEPTLRGLLDSVKIADFKGVSASSKKVDGGWLNKFFINTGGENEGVYGIVKSKGEQWGYTDYAHADTDLLVEQTQNLEALKILLLDLSNQVGGEFQKTLKKGLNYTPKGATKKINDSLGKVQLRTTLIGEFDHNHKVKVVGGTEMPNFNLAIRVEGGATLWPFFAEDIEKDSDVTVSGDLKYVRSPKSYPFGNSFPKIQPLFVIDQKNDVLWFVMREAYYQKCISGDNRLANSEKFKAATNGLPNNGYLFHYLSQESYKLIESFYDKKLLNHVKERLIGYSPSIDEDLMYELGVTMITEDMLPALSSSENGYASSVSLNKDGLLFVAQEPIATKGIPLSIVNYGYYPLVGIYVSASIEETALLPELLNKVN